VVLNKVEVSSAVSKEAGSRFVIIDYGDRIARTGYRKGTKRSPLTLAIRPEVFLAENKKHNNKEELV
jgi:hypothetical protein